MDTAIPKDPMFWCFWGPTFSKA